MFKKTTTYENTHSQCVFFDLPQQQGSSKLQASKPPQKTHILIVYFCGGFYLSLLI
jgi:hypothetical protein